MIPVKNAGQDLERCLAAIARQRVDEDVETIVVDSSSTDGSADVARAFGARVHVIQASEFNHGATRNLGASLARGETLVFTSQDAYALDDHWLDALVTPLRADAGVAGVYGRQLPHEDARPPEVYFLDFLYGPDPRVQEATTVDQLSMETTLFSNVSAAMRRDVWEELRFVDDIVMSEDQEWARRALLAGYRLVYEPRAVVRHSHVYSIGSAFRRFFDSGVSAERAYLAGARPSAAVLRRAAIEYGRGEARWLLRTRQARWLPYTAVYELGKFAGLQLGARHRRLPLWMKKRFSAMPAYWDAGV